MRSWGLILCKHPECGQTALGRKGHVVSVPPFRQVRERIGHPPHGKCGLIRLTGGIALTGGITLIIKSLESFLPPQFLQEYENDIPTRNVLPPVGGVGEVNATKLFWKETPGFIEANIRCRVCEVVPVV